MQILQSKVGKHLSNLAIYPPILGFFSTRTTSYPWSPRSSEAEIPATPPPTINALGVTGTVIRGRGSDQRDFATPIFTNSLDFSVASSGACP